MAVILEDFYHSIMRCFSTEYHTSWPVSLGADNRVPTFGQDWVTEDQTMVLYTTVGPCNEIDIVCQHRAGFC